MEKGRWKKRLIVLLVICAMIAGAVILMQLRPVERVEDISADKLRWAVDLLTGSLNSSEPKYTDYLMKRTGDMGQETAEAYPENGQDADAFSGTEFTVLPYEGTLTVLQYGETAEYRVTLARPFTEEQKAELLRGVMLKDERRPVLARALEVDGDSVLISIGEGLYHQVRRMFAAVGNHVETLKREAIGPVVLDQTLGKGGWRYLTAEEVASLT